MGKFILSNLGEFNTSEGYFGNAYMDEDFITIPYINMGLLKDHPLNFSSAQIFVDFSYIHIVKPTFLSVYNRGIIRNDKTEGESFYLGGLFVGDESVINNEIEVKASEVLLIMPKYFKCSTKIWIPDINEFNGRGTIAINQVLDFFSTTSEVNKAICRLCK